MDKFQEMGLTPVQSVSVKSPSIKESPVNIECRLVDILEYGSHHMFVAEVVSVTVEDSLMDEKGKLELAQAGLVAYSHGEYFELGKKVGQFGFSVNKKKREIENKQKKEIKNKQKRETDSKQKRKTKNKQKNKLKTNKN